MPGPPHVGPKSTPASVPPLLAPLGALLARALLVIRRGAVRVAVLRPAGRLALALRLGLVRRLALSLALLAVRVAAVLVAAVRARRRFLLVALLFAVAVLRRRLLAVLEPLGRLHLDVCLEAGEIGLDRALRETKPGGHLLEHPGRGEIHRDHDGRQPVVELVEADDSGMRRARDGLPGDQLVLAAVGDLAFPLPLAEPDLLLPAELVVLLLLDAEDAVHELGELLELGPLLVDGRDGRRDVRPALD